MRKNCPILCLLFSLVSAVFAQDLIWSEPIQVSETGGAVSLFEDSEGRMWVGWIEDSVTYARYYYGSDTSEVFILNNDLEPETAIRPMVWGESGDGLIWAFVRSGGIMSGTCFDGIGWSDSLCFDPIFCAYSERQITFTDSLGQLLLFFTCGTQIFYYMWDFSEWSGPYIATQPHYSPLYPLAVIYDSCGALQFYYQSCGISITVPVYYNEVFVGLDSVSDRRSILYHTGSDHCYINIFPEPDGDVFSFDLFDAIRFNIGKLWALYYKSGVVESCYVDSAASLPLRVRAVNTWGPINKLETGNYLITWTVFNSVDTTYIGIYNKLTSNIDTIYTTPDTVISRIAIDHKYLIWIVLWGSGVRIKHSIDTTSYIRETSLRVPESYIEDIYPNPYNSRLSVVLFFQNDGNYRLSLYDVNGKLINTIFQNTLKRGKTRLEFVIEDLPSGLYFLTLLKEGVILDKRKTILLK